MKRKNTEREKEKKEEEGGQKRMKESGGQEMPVVEGFCWGTTMKVLNSHPNLIGLFGLEFSGLRRGWDDFDWSYHDPCDAFSFHQYLGGFGVVIICRLDPCLLLCGAKDGDGYKKFHYGLLDGSVSTEINEAANTALKVR
jgi:hypothetical protein